MFRKLILLIVSTISFYSSVVFSVGLGDYELHSGLNQPFNAKIKLLSAEEFGEHEIMATLASAQEFEKLGVERLFLLNNLRFKTVREESGDLAILLSSRQPIKEPFLNFLVELNWPSGRFIREYTFLLDPPIFDESTTSTIEKTQTTTPAKIVQKKRISQPPREVQPDFTGSSYGPVSANDTLWSIASKTRPSSQVSIHQTLVAIYRANPHAFAEGNINNLLRGKVLQIPDADTISQVPHRAALQDVVTQNRQWQSGGTRRIVTSGSKQSSSKAGTGEARLTLVSPGDDDKPDSEEAGNLNRELSQAKDELVRSQELGATLQAENDELRERLADALQKLEVTQNEAAVNISDTELAVLTQDKSEQELKIENNLGVDGGGSTEGDIEQTMKGSTPGEAAIDANDGAGQIGGAESIGDTKSESQIEKPMVQTALPTKQTGVTQPIVPEKSFLQQLLDSGAVLWGGILVAVLLLAFAVFWRMRMRMEEEDFQDDLVASAGAGSMDTTETFELPDVGDDMLVELDMDETDDEIVESEDESFDPIGEADIYIAYGKYEQAENLLLKAIEDNPVRSDLKMKLMECYAESEDKDKFEDLASEVSQAIDAEEWQEQINAMREQAWSGVSGGGEGFDLPSTEDIFGEEESALESELDSVMEDTVEEKATETDDSDDFSLYVGEDTAEDEFDIDMDFDIEEPAETDVEEGSEATSQTFDSVDDVEFSLEESGESDETDIAGESAEVEEDFTFDIEEDDEMLALDDSEDLSLDDDDFNFEEDEDSEFEIASDGEDDEISTKLDLARAYIDMGDSDGAKEILAEVVAEGNESQQSEAHSLLERAD